MRELCISSQGHHKATTTTTPTTTATIPKMSETIESVWGDLSEGSTSTKSASAGGRRAAFLADGASTLQGHPRGQPRHQLLFKQCLETEESDETAATML